MATTGKIVGYKGQFYIKVDGAARTKLAHFSGYELSVSADSVEASDHDTDGWKDKLDGMREWTATIDMVTFLGDASQESVIAAVLAGGKDVVCSFRPIDEVDAQSYVGTARITSFKDTAKMSTAQARNLTLTGRGALIRELVSADA